MTSVSTTGANALAWKQTTPGTFTRPLDTIESFFKWLADLGVPLKREHWGVSLALRLSLPDSLSVFEAEPYIRRAWLILSKQHPMLYARPEGNTATVGPLYEDEWLNESFFTHTEEQVTVDSLYPCRSQESRRQPSADRRQGCSLDRPAPDPRHRKGHPGAQLARASRARQGDHGRRGGSLQVARHQGDVRRARRHCASRRGAPAAPSGQALLHHHGRRHATPSPRRRKQGRRAPSWPRACSSRRAWSSSPSPPRPGAAPGAFDAIARGFDATYGADMSRLYDAGGGETVGVAQATAPFARRIVPLLQMPQPEGMPPQNVPHLSSIGVVERWLKRDCVVDGEKGSRIAVEDVWLGGEMITPALCNHVWTWRDQMTLAAVFNTAYYEEAFCEAGHGGCEAESAVRSANLRLRYGNAWKGSVGNQG